MDLSPILLWVIALLYGFHKVSSAPLETSNSQSRLALPLSSTGNGSLLSVPCEESHHCTNQTQFAHCNFNLGLCQCNSGFQPNTSKSCSKIDTLEHKLITQLIERTPVLPVLCVLGLMFVFLCVVLQLFSKARFKHTSRSIFVNPQNLKVAQAQERRLSQLSQVSANGCNRSPYSPHRSPAYSNQSARSSYASNIIANNEYRDRINSASSVILKAKSRSNSISNAKLC